MVFGLALDMAELAIRSGSYLCSGIYYGGYRIIYGIRKDPILSKLEALENRLDCIKTQENSENLKCYWKLKHKFQNLQWVVIANNNVICQTFNKIEALRQMSNHIEDFPDISVLITQVGNETKMFEI